MKYNLELTNAAQHDLVDIFRYIAKELKALQTASDQLDRLKNAVGSLNTMPERYRLYEKEPWKSRNVRMMPVDRYIVFYVPDKDAQTVTVLRILYAGRDIARHLV